MSKDSIIDYWGFILFRLFGPLIRGLPLNFNYFLGKTLGEFLYYFDTKHKSVAYSNIKTAFRAKLSPSRVSNLTKEFYRNFGQSLIEIFLIPLVNKEYINKYISIEGLEYINEGFKKGRGLILLGVHAGSWELSNVICADLGFPFSLFVRNQRHPRLNELLNSYRSQKGCRIIQRQNQIRRLIQALKNNEAIGMTADQGGKTGIQVKFFGKDASMPTGAVRLALKYNATLIPAFYIRIAGPYIKVIIKPPFQIKRTGDKDKDIQDNLQELVHIFERYILKYPKEYLWSYKIYKYAKEKNILVLSDGKTGHLRQAEAVVGVISSHFFDKGISTNVDTVEIKFKNKFARFALNFSSILSGKYHCQGCLWCLRTFLKKDIYNYLLTPKPDIVVSCGWSVAPINFIISRENLAKSIVVMRPSILSTKRFDLVIMPRHDSPPKKKNIVITEGALNLIDEQYLKNCILHIAYCISQGDDKRLAISDKQFYMGLLIGGDTKHFHLKDKIILEVINQIKSVSRKWNANILVTTSRRTSEEIEFLLKKEFKDYPACKLLIIANEKNIPQALGGILGLSQFLVISPESISMISEAVNSKKYVLVFDSLGLGTKHKRFLKYFAKNRYIYLVKPSNLGKTIEYIWLNKPSIHTLRDNLIISEAIKKIL